MTSSLIFGQPVGENFNCDNPLHGYGCFHLDEDFTKLTPKETEQYKSLKKYFGFETIAEVERAIKEDQDEVASKQEEIDELEAGIDEMQFLKNLMEKKDGRTRS